MKAILRYLAGFIDTAIWMVSLITIMICVGDRWPAAFSIMTSFLAVVFGAWYLWKFAIQPFRAGLRGK
jgi:hypothetical protein